jgi:asparagine synthase (glutamine-hydrolysing)
MHFGSEEKALFAGGVHAEFDQACWEELICFRYVAGENTPFRGVKRLLPGHYVTWKDGEITTKRWWNLSERARAKRHDLPADAVKWYGETFEDSVRLRRISDVPVGVLLSGGLDSSCVAAALAEQAESRVSSFTVRFRDSGYDESPLAKEVAKQCNLDYHDLLVSDDELLSRMRRASWLYDEPLAHGNDLHIWAISQYAKPLVTVLLSGEGADETLGGYVRYQPLRYPALLKGGRAAMPMLARIPRVNSRIRKLRRFLRLGPVDRFVLYNSCDVLPFELADLGILSNGIYPFRERILDEARALYPNEPVRQVMYSDQHTFLCSLLDRNDRMTMGASIECRVPLLDYRLVEGVASLPSSTVFAGHRGKGKHLLRESAGKRVPESVRMGRKWGFATPWKRYLRQSDDLRDLLNEIPRSAPFVSGPFDKKRLSRAIEGFQSGDDALEMLMRQLVMIAVWHEACCGSARRLPQVSLS